MLAMKSQLHKTNGRNPNSTFRSAQVGKSVCKKFKTKLDLEKAKQRAEAVKTCLKKHQEYMRQKQREDPVQWTNSKYWEVFHSSINNFLDLQG
jgi:hypothetical protein